MDSFVLGGRGVGHRVHDALGEERVALHPLDGDGDAAAGADLLQRQRRKLSTRPVLQVLDHAALDHVTIGPTPVRRDDSEHPLELFEQFLGAVRTVIGVQDEVLGPVRYDPGGLESRAPRQCHQKPHRQQEATTGGRRRMEETGDHGNVEKGTGEWATRGP